jgi:hypothetical protein
MSNIFTSQLQLQPPVAFYDIYNIVTPTPSAGFAISHLRLRFSPGVVSNDICIYLRDFQPSLLAPTSARSSNFSYNFDSFSCHRDAAMGTDRSAEVAQPDSFVEGK